MARATKRTPEVESILCKALEQGASRRAACAAARIGVQTLSDWLKSNRDFRDLIARAEALAEITYTGVIMKAARPHLVTRTKERTIPNAKPDLPPIKIVETFTEEVIDWRPAAFWLTRRRPMEWGEGNVGDLTDEQLIAALKSHPAMRGEMDEQAS